MAKILRLTPSDILQIALIKYVKSKIKTFWSRKKKCKYAGLFERTKQWDQVPKEKDIFSPGYLSKNKIFFLCFLFKIFFSCE